ncbi:MAG: phenylacetate-CoA oxygenase subunit PaaC [Chloroflexota bacterium]|nr:phenylacetate-CoA oxygenase subunit PaaC [Chloroflexota bacterium]
MSTILAASSEPRDAGVRDALAELILSMADDEFVIGYWDSEWTGIAPMLEEDVAFSSIAQDEIGHARALYELLADITGGDADGMAYGRSPEAYRHARLLNHARGDWAFTIARRYLYDTADAIRLEALASGSYARLAQLVAKVRREETYHLLHMDAWIRRFADGPPETRDRLADALARLWPEAGSVLAPLDGDALLVREGILAAPFADLRARWIGHVGQTLRGLALPAPPSVEPPSDARTRRTEDFRWLWRQFTMVARSEEGATW